MTGADFEKETTTTMYARAPRNAEVRPGSGLIERALMTGGAGSKKAIQEQCTRHSNSKRNSRKPLYCAVCHREMV